MRQIKDYDEDTVNNWVGRQTPLGLFMKVVIALIALSLFLGFIGFVFGWFNTAKDIVSPTNVKEQYTQIYQDYRSLQAIAGNACGLQDAVKNASSADEKSQRESELLATEQNYRRVAALYNARWDNVFEAKVVGPHDTPTTAPSLKKMEKQVC